MTNSSQSSRVGLISGLMCAGGMGEEVEFLLIMASPKPVVLPTEAYLSLTVIYRTGHTEKTTKVGSAVHI